MSLQITQDSFVKMLLFILLGIVIGILVLGLHASPTAQPAAPIRSSAPSSMKPAGAGSTYPSNQSMYK